MSDFECLLHFKACLLKEIGAIYYFISRNSENIIKIGRTYIKRHLIYFLFKYQLSSFQTLCHTILSSHDLELELPNILSAQLSFLAFVYS